MIVGMIAKFGIGREIGFIGERHDDG